MNQITIEAMKERIVYERGAFGVDPDKLAAELVRLEEKIDKPDLAKIMNRDQKIYTAAYLQALRDVEENLGHKYNNQSSIDVWGSLWTDISNILSSLRDKQK